MPSIPFAVRLRVLAVAWAGLTLAGLGIATATLFTGRPVPLPDPRWLVPVVVVLFVAGVVFTMAVQSRPGYSWWHMAIGGSGAPLLVVSLLGLGLALTGFLATGLGIPGDPSPGCPHPISRPTAEHCVDADEYDRVAAGTQRWVVGLAAMFFAEFTRHAVNLSVRRRRPPLSSTVDNPL